MNQHEIHYQIGIPEHFRLAAVKLYDEAFGAKFSVAVPSDQQRRLLLNNTFNLDFAIAAIQNERLVGLAGFHAPKGSLTGGITYHTLRSQLGFIKGHWAALIFSMYERKIRRGELVMDGIAVKADVRGQGVGSRLLDDIMNYAAQHEFKHVRLDVIDTNPKAKKLYERKGFSAIKTESFPYLRWLFGFGGVTTMVLNAS